MAPADGVHPAGTVPAGMPPIMVGMARERAPRAADAGGAEKLAPARR